MELFKIVLPESLVSKNSGQYCIPSTSIVPKRTFIIMTPGMANLLLLN